MLDPRASRFWQASILSGLMDVENLIASWNAIPPEKRESPEHIDRRLARQAVQSNALTLWQAQQLLAGRTSGFKVDRYVLLDMIGQGGMGRVYLARDTRLNRRVALKILSPERLSNPRAIARFHREARVGAQLEHENLVRVYDFGESNGRFYLVMEYIEGKTVGTMISEQGPLALAVAARLVRQVALGLEHAHRKGMIHRDVNPYNILVTHEGTAKLADLGLAIDLADGERVTRDGATVGTFDYVAPEQARHSHAADIRSDIYSLGCTFYHMLTGQVPFPSPSLPEKLFAHQALEPTPLSQLTPMLPEGLVQMVQRMMRKSPGERYSSPIQVALAVEPYIGESISSARASAGEQPSGRPAPAEEASAPPAGSQDSAAARSPVPIEPMAIVAASLRSDPSQGVAVSRDAAEMARAALQTAGRPHRLSTPSEVETSASPSPESTALESPVSLLTSVHDLDEAKPEISLDLDLGPEPPLSEGIPVPASSTSWPALRWVWWLLAVVALVTALVVLLMQKEILGPFITELTHNRFGSRKVLDSASDQTQPAGTSQTDIVVRDGIREIPFADLKEAMENAMGFGGYVELRNREPLRLPAGKSISVSTRGRLSVRAAPGTKPVLEIELSAARPSLLTTGSAVTLELSGLTILVRYPPAARSPAPAPPPLIKAAGTVTLERCAFQVAGNGQVKDSSVMALEGNKLTVERCWFQGFDKPIKVLAFQQTVVRLKQTIIVAGTSPTAAPGAHGWGVEVEIAARPDPKTNDPRRLVLENCTVEGTGLLDLRSLAEPKSGPTSGSPFRVEVKHCAIRADTLLACSSGLPSTQQLRWLGQGNQYDILGRNWIVLTGSYGTPAPSTNATDLATWFQFHPEKDPIPARLEFRTDPGARSNPPRPQDFVIEAPPSPAATPGADPDQVGPWGR
jgi:serine/threonine-protein kinase